MSAKLTNKIFISGSIYCQTGLRIGGNKSSLEIGGVDLNIIKGANGEPYIPGSSLKGKMRSLLGKIIGSENAANDSPEMLALFGKPGANDKNKTDDKNEQKNTNTRLFVRDAKLNTTEFIKKFNDRDKRDFDFSETKTENVIDRSTGAAKHPRNIERVPAGATFDFSMVVDMYEGDKEEVYCSLIENAIELIHYDYLGGHGSRGSGEVKININSIKGKAFSADGIIDQVSAIWTNLQGKINSIQAIHTKA